MLALFGLARAFAPDFTASLVDRATALVTVTITSPPPPPPSASPDPSPTPDEGAAGEPAKQAIPKQIAAPAPAIALPSPIPIPRATSTGNATQSGAREDGAGTGAGDPGEGTGSGRGGRGQGGAPVTAPVKIAGDINNAADYPIPEGGRQARVGQSVTIAMTVTVAGRAQDCRVLTPSNDPVADRITCDLAVARFRFRPARNAAGEPVPATYGWRQSWFRK